MKEIVIKDKMKEIVIPRRKKAILKIKGKQLNQWDDVCLLIFLWIFVHDVNTEIEKSFSYRATLKCVLAATEKWDINGLTELKETFRKMKF